MPSEWSIALSGPARPIIPLEAPHAVVSRWLDSDHRAQVKPYSIQPPVWDGDATRLTVRLLDDDLAPALLQAATPGMPVRLGRHHFTVASPPAAHALQPWDELEATPTIRAWDVTFTTPTTFRRGRRTSPWPAPTTVLASLAARWAAVRGPDGPRLSREAAATIWVSDVEGRSEPLELKGTVVSGFVGRVRYVCDGDDADAAAASTLFAFAAFAGIGSYTAFGLGAVRLARTWQPRSGAGTADRRGAHRTAPLADATG